MSKLLSFVFGLLLSMSSALAANINVLTDDPDWEPGEDYIEYDVLIQEGCHFIKKYEDKQLFVPDVRWYYLFDSKKGYLLASYKVNKECTVFKANEEEGEYIVD